MDDLATGAIAMGYAVAGLFFLRFWRKTRDRLFALFALAFVVLSLNRVADGVFPGVSGAVYWVRFAAFALILAAIVDKNRPRTPDPGHSSPVTTRPGPVTPPTRPPAPG
jgi:hypothetical protein